MYTEAGMRNAVWDVTAIGINPDTTEASVNNVLYPVSFAFHAGGRRVPASIIKKSDASIKPRGTKVM
jgi:hypothetical protein